MRKSLNLIVSAKIFKQTENSVLSIEKVAEVKPNKERAPIWMRAGFQQPHSQNRGQSPI